MQDNESPRSFPQPSRNYEGPILDPLFVEEEYAETVGIVRRFASGNAGFTEEKILQHLAANGVSLYGTQEDWEDLFAEIRDQIVSDAAERKLPVQISWVVQQLGEKVTYSMMEVSTTDTAETAQAGAAEIAIPATHEVPEVGQEKIPDELDMFLGGMRSILERSANGMVHHKELTAAVARRFGVDLVEANRLIGKAFSARQLTKVSSQGSVYVTQATAEQTEEQAELPVGQETEISDERPPAEIALEELDAYMQVVAYVMQSLIALRDISMGQPYDRLWRRSNLEEVMDFLAFKRYLRRMESDGLVLIIKDAKLSTTTSRSKILRGSKVLVSDKHIRSSWRVNAKENLHAMYEEALEILLEEHT